MNKAYIICFDRGGLLDFVDYNKFHDALIIANGVLNWWHYLECTYIIITPAAVTATSVAQFVTQQMPGKHSFTSEINLQNHNGFLPQEAWNWINQVNLNSNLI